MKYFLQIRYDGTDYSGWQRQPQYPSIQGRIEDGLKQVTGQKINLIGCGRTDAGVHAENYYAHITINQSWQPLWLNKLTDLLPSHINIIDVWKAPEHAHAQKDAIFRTYTYRILDSRLDSGHYNISHYDLSRINHNTLQQATLRLHGEHDFRSFCKQPDHYPNTLCTITEASWSKTSEPSDLIIFRITANRFLRRMIRILIPQLFAVGAGKLDFEEFISYLEDQQEIRFRSLAHPKGLSFTTVTYPFVLQRI